MAFVSISSGDIDAGSPLSDALFSIIKDDLDYLKSILSDGSGSPQNIVSSSMTLAGAGTALNVTNNVVIAGSLSISGQLTTGNIFSSEQLLDIFV